VSSDSCLIEVRRCARCRGRGDLPCPDPQCGDSTWDHACEEGADCQDCLGKGFTVSLLDRPPGAKERWGGRRPTGVAESVAKMVELRGQSPAWREKAREVVPLLLVIQRLDEDRATTAMLGVRAIAGLVHMARELFEDPEWQKLIEEVRDAEDGIEYGVGKARGELPDGG